MTEVIDDVFSDKFFTQYLLEGLISTKGWQICSDNFYESSVGDSDFESSKYSDPGVILETFNQERPPQERFGDHRLNAYGDLIFTKILHLSQYQYEGVGVLRYFWNYYNRSSTGLYHLDMTDADPPGNYCSIVFYINESDGGTYLEKEFFEHKANRAIIFNSKTPHRGVGPTNAKQRWNLNIIFKYDTVSKKTGTSNRILL
jgi:hypothetical protein